MYFIYGIISTTFGINIHFAELQEDTHKSISCALTDDNSNLF